jgi:hypothetical protein
MPKIQQIRNLNVFLRGWTLASLGVGVRHGYWASEIQRPAKDKNGVSNESLRNLKSKIRNIEPETWNL